MRVIAGRLGGRKLHAPKGEGTRPTSDRVKEALFSILGDLTGLRVLDLYAGTGGLGIEAKSRGATEIVFVEQAPPALAALKKNLAELGIARESKVVASSVERAVARLADSGPFDLALVDPPYVDAPAALVACETLTLRGALGVDALVVIEHDRATRFESERLEVVDTRTYGTTALSFLRPRV